MEKNFKGKFLIHSLKIPDLKDMKMFGFNKLLLGVIVGKAELVDGEKYKNDFEYRKDRNKHLADFSLVKHGFILKNAKRIKPIKVKGKLMFWDF